MPGSVSMLPRQQVTKVVAVLVMALMSSCVWTVSAGCGRLVRQLDFSRRSRGDYNQQMLLDDMAPYSYFDSPDRASIATVGGKSYLALEMKKGCYGTSSKCGMQGRLPLGVSLEEATLSMTVRFSSGFDWVRGGKLPGFCGGTCPTGCQNDDKGFSTRIMWTDNVCKGASAAGVACDKGRSGGLHAYSYYKGKPSSIGCGQELTLESKGRNGKVHNHVIYPNRDYLMSVHVRLNAPGKSDGDITVWLGSTRMGSLRGIEIRGSGQKFKIEQILFQNFFGGSSNMAAKKDETIYLKDLRVWEGYCRPGQGSTKAVVVRSSRTQSKSTLSKDVALDAGRPSQQPSWRQYSLDPSGFLKPSNQLRTKDLRIDTAFNGGFCAKFYVSNFGRTTCSDYVVELNIDPSFGYLQKFGKSFAQVSADKSQGYYLFKRGGGLSPKITPGTTRSEGFCALGNTKAQWRSDQLLNFFSVNVVCNGLSTYSSGKRASAV